MTYSYPDRHDGITSEDLAKLPPEMQGAVMKQWFFEHFESPEESTPYDPEESGYIWIWGGPYDALEELEAEFSDVVGANLIKELATELTEESFQWSAIPEDEAPDDYLVDASRANVNPGATARRGLERIRSLLGAEIPSENELHMCGLLYVNAITCLEAYLFDTVLNQVMGDEGYKRRFVETSPEFAKRKTSMCEIYHRMEGLDKELKDHLFSMLWHDLGRAKRVYESVFAIEWPDISRLAKAVRNRHDIVHRNGKSKDGNDIILSKEKVEALITDVQTFIDSIDEKLAPF